MSARELATIRRVGLTDGVACALKLLHVTHVAYLVDAQREWDGASPPRSLEIRAQFNWPSVFSYQSSATVLAVHYDGATQALMQFYDNKAIYDPQASRTAHVYVAFLEVAPWNRAQSANRRFAGLEQVLVRMAFERVQQLVPRGKLGLHATRSAETFYQQLGFTQLPLGTCENEFREAYFELEAQRRTEL